MRLFIVRHNRGNNVAVGARPRRGAAVLGAIQPADARPSGHAVRGFARVVHIQVYPSSIIFDRPRTSYFF